MTVTYYGNQQVSKSLFYQQLVDSPPPIVAIDTETVSLKEKLPIGFSIAVSPHDAWWFDSYPEPDPEIQMLGALMANPSIKKVYANVMFDIRVQPLIFQDFPYDESNIADVLVMARILGRTNASLHDLAAEVGRSAQDAKDLLAEYGAQTMLELPPEVLSAKCANDAMVALALYNFLEPQMKTLEGLAPDYLDVESKVVPILVDMSQRGLTIDQEARAVLEKKMEGDRDYYKNLCTEHDFNPGSGMQTGYILAKRGCLYPSTKVLKSDLSWTQASELEEGESLVAVEEFIAGHGRRHLVESIVLRTQRIELPSYEIRFTDGRTIIASGGHMWLEKSIGTHRLNWARTDQLKIGSLLKQLCWSTWETEYSYDAGYLAGSLDSEGSVDIYSGVKVVYSQNEGETLERIRTLLHNFGFSLREWRSKDDKGIMLKTTSTDEALRLLGSIRPERLLARLDMWGKGLPREAGLAKVSAIEYLGNREVIGLDTTTKTLIAEGLISHNSFLPFTKTKKQLKTDEETLETLDDPLAAVVLGYKRANSILTKYLYPLRGKERIYTEYGLDTEVGRTKSSDFNMQNIPAATSRVGIDCRHIFLPDTGTFTTGDFSQLHLRFLMHMSGDTEMKRVYYDGKDGGDIHLSTAGKIHKPRRIAKIINYAIPYGGDPHTLAKQLHTRDLSWCSQLIDDWFDAYPDAAEWIKEARHYAIRNGKALPTLFGRQIAVPEEWNKWGKLAVDAMERKGANYPILGSDGEVMKRALIICAAHKLPLAVQVHDSITCDGDINFPIVELDSLAPVPTPFDVEKSERWK